jgi:hypothetical protein
MARLLDRARDLLRDRLTGVTSRVNVGPGGVQADAEALGPPVRSTAKSIQKAAPKKARKAYAQERV